MKISIGPDRADASPKSAPIMRAYRRGRLKLMPPLGSVRWTYSTLTVKDELLVLFLLKPNSWVPH